jgi:hypothetical protein
MTKTGWIAVAVGAIGAGALVLYRMGKKVAAPGNPFEESPTGVVSPFPFEEVTATTPKAIVAQAEVATEVAGQAAAQYTQLMAEKAQLEQRAFIAEDRLNAALAEQTPMGTADAQTFDAERQALLAQIAANEAAGAQAVATAEAAQQSIDAAAQSMADAAERERVLTDAVTKAETDRVARELEIARQNQATSELGTTPPGAPGSGTPSNSGGNGVILPDGILDNVPKYRQAEQLLIQLWMEEYPKQTTNAARLLWFKKLEAGILATEKVAPGFGDWLLKTNKPLLDKMLVEKKKASAEVVGPNDIKLAAWKVASVATLDYWTKVYPGQTDVMKAKGLVAIVIATQKTEKAAPGYMKWFDITYPGVSAKMIAEGDRLKNVAVPGSTATGEKPPAEANAQASKATIDAYNALVAGWAQYQKLTTEAQRKAAMTAVWAASVTPQGKIVWAYATSVNPNFVAAVTAEIKRLTATPSAAGKFKPATSAAPAGGGVGARTVPSGGGVGARTAPVSAATISVYNQIVSGWAAYPKLAESQRKAWLQTVYSIITTPAGQIAWAYANTVNPSLVSAISTEMARPATPAKSSGGMSLGNAKNKAAPKGAPPRAGVNKKLAGLEEVNDYVTRAKQLRDAARILHADAAQHANVNMRLHRAMGR